MTPDKTNSEGCKAQRSRNGVDDVTQILVDKTNSGWMQGTDVKEWGGWHDVTPDKDQFRVGTRHRKWRSGTGCCRLLQGWL